MSEPLDKLREQDEAFWQQQEQRLQGCLGQPCCTLSGICTVLMNMPGRLAVIIHGEADCANSFHHHQGPGAAHFFATRLTEQQVTTGQTAEALADCLTQVVDEIEPEAALVLGTCLIEVINDPFEQVVAELAARTGVPMRALHTSGLKLGTQAEMLDWLFAELASLPAIRVSDPAWINQVHPRIEQLGSSPPPRRLEEGHRFHRQLADLPEPRELDPASGVNLVGLPESRGRNPEPVGLLAKIGIQVNGQYPFGAGLDDWRAIGQVEVTAVADRSLYPRLTGNLERAGQGIVEVPLPIGLSQTETFYQRIAQAFGRAADLETVLGEARDPAQRALASFAQRHRGLRMAMGLRMLNNYRADQLAYEGLGDALALAELGLELTLMVQGPPEESARARFQARLTQLGCDLPFQVFPDPWNLSERLAQGDYDVAYLADHSREEAAKADLPMIVSRGLRPYFAGVPANADLMDQLLAASGVAK